MADFTPGRSSKTLQGKPLKKGSRSSAFLRETMQIKNRTSGGNIGKATRLQKKALRQIFEAEDRIEAGRMKDSPKIRKLLKEIREDIKKTEATKRNIFKEIE